MEIGGEGKIRSGSVDAWTATPRKMHKTYHHRGDLAETLLEKDVGLVSVDEDLERKLV
jgi:hypothetical protein